VRRGGGLFRRAVELSILLHLLLLFVILPRASRVWPAAQVVVPVVPPVPAERPLEFEFVDLPEDREEAPPEDRPVPLSDRDRRAHGGEGEASTRPGVRGTTPQLVQSDGGRQLDRGQPASRPGVPAPPSPSQVDPVEPRPEPEVRREPEGVGETVPTPRPAVPLPAPGSWSSPPLAGGLPERPDRPGGKVDAGGLSFDTQWYDWGPYAKRMLAKIRKNWRIPEIAMLGVQGVVKIRFFIERDGRVTGLQIVDESGKPPMDFAARDAIADSSAFEPLPADLTGVEREGVTITFYYNLRPPTWRGEE